VAVEGKGACALHHCLSVAKRFMLCVSELSGRPGARMQFRSCQRMAGGAKEPVQPYFSLTLG
jgi:hypothetical protein